MEEPRDARRNQGRPLVADHRTRHVAYTMWADGGYRGRFGMSIPPLLEALGRVELTHQPRNNRVVR